MTLEEHWEELNAAIDKAKRERDEWSQKELAPRTQKAVDKARAAGRGFHDITWEDIEAETP